MTKSTNESALALIEVSGQLRDVRAANAAYRKAPSEKTETVVHDAYEALTRGAGRAKDAMPVPSPVLRRAMARRSCRFGVDKYVEMAILEEANEQGGFHFFATDATGFFGSRYASHGHQGTHEVYFVTSEKRPGDGNPRGWTVRVMHANGSIDSIGNFQAYASSKAAERAAQKLVEESRAAKRPIGAERARPATVST